MPSLRSRARLEQADAALLLFTDVRPEERRAARDRNLGRGWGPRRAGWRNLRCRADQRAQVLVGQRRPGVVETERTAELVLSLHAADRSIVVIEHDMDFVQRVADQVSVLHEGRTLLEGQGVRDDAVLDEVCTLFPVRRTMWRRRGGDLSAASSSNSRLAAR